MTSDPVRDGAQSTQRARVGMIGLAAILLLIGLAAAFAATVNRERPTAVAGGANAEVVANMVASNESDAARDAGEPLAQLGVAPSAEVAPDNTTQAETRAAPAAPAPQR